MYNKLFTKILDSSIWLEPDPHRLVWITLMAAMDEDGNAHFASIKNLAFRARVSEEDCASAIKSFESPDPDSGDPDNEGRRVERFPGGWHVLNAHKYRDMVTKAIIREKTRQRVAKYRKKKGQKECNAPVTPSNDSVTQSISKARSISISENKNIMSGKPDVSPPKVDKNKEYREQAKSIINFLNEKTGRNYRHVDANLIPVIARLKSGVPFARVKGVVAKKSRDWGANPNQEPYLRPKTLFGAQNFENYLGELPKEED